MSRGFSLFVVPIAGFLIGFIANPSSDVFQAA
jgi:biotin transporter BioY